MQGAARRTVLRRRVKARSSRDTHDTGRLERHNAATSDIMDTQGSPPALETGGQAVLVAHLRRGTQSWFTAAALSRTIADDLSHALLRPVSQPARRRHLHAARPAIDAGVPAAQFERQLPKPRAAAAHLVRLLAGCNASTDHRTANYNLQSIHYATSFASQPTYVQVRCLVEQGTAPASLHVYTGLPKKLAAHITSRAIVALVQFRS